MSPERLKKSIAESFANIMDDMGVPLDENSLGTPDRVAKMYVNELFANMNVSTLDLASQMTQFPAKNQNPVKVKDIRFTSTCAHHWLPFTGYATVEYVPDKTIVGLSKIPRVVKWFSKKPQVQEDLTNEIGEFLVSTLDPHYLQVTLHDVHHSCVEARGVEAECTTDTTYTYYKPFEEGEVSE